jgi:hypothetical protein
MIAMVEANPVKFYIAKYFFLVFALIQWTIGGMLLFFDRVTVATLVIAFFFFAFGLFLIVLFSIVSERIKRVAVGDRKFVIVEENSTIRFEWPDVKSLRIVPLLNLCKVRIKGRKGTFYFFLAGNIRAAVEALLMQSKSEKKQLDVNNPSLM